VFGEEPNEGNKVGFSSFISSDLRNLASVQEL